MTQVSCRFAQVTDLHLSLGSTDYGPDGDATMWISEGALHERVVTTPAVLAALFAAISEAEPELDFIVATGDLTNDGRDTEFEAYADVVRSAPVRIVSIPGNHDHHNAAAAADAGEPLPYERYLGPRWFSFDEGGVHFAAIDWFTHRLGLDTAIQDEWLAADLAQVPEGTPVVLLTHDQMPAAFFDALPRRPVASFSGHWHTTRVVEHAGTLHVNTGPATFAGLDYCPPHYRVVQVDGAGVTLRTTVQGGGTAGGTMRAGPPPTGPVPRGGWVAPLGGGVQFAGAEIVDGVVVVAGKCEDRPSAEVVALDPATGERVWAHQLTAAVKATPRAAGDTVVACTVAGEVVCIDAASGDLRWQTWLHADPLYLWDYLRPAVDGRLVFAGDVGAFAALDLSTGGVRWTRSDLGHRENLTTVAEPMVTGGVLVGTFAGQTPALFGLDPLTGTTLWPPGEVRGIYQAGVSLAVALPQVVVGGVTVDPDTDDVYVIRLGSTVERLRSADGSVVWSARFHGWFNPAAPVVTGDALVASTSTGQVWCYDRASGEKRWSTIVSTDAPLAMGAYRADGASVLAGVLPLGDRLLQPCGDGRIVVLDRGNGAVVDAIDVGAPIAAPLARVGELVIAVGVDGWVRALPMS